MKIQTTKLMGFYSVFMDIYWALVQVLFFAPCLRPHRAEDKVQIKAQLGGMPATGLVPEYISLNGSEYCILEATRHY